MCGIAGLALRVWNERLAADFAGCTAQFLARRGPDGFKCEKITPSLIFTQTRLSIIDLAGGVQPMSDDAGALVYNGEIYNYRALRDAAFSWRTQSDTEVLLQGINRQGLDFLDSIDGMFAFAHYDKNQETLTLARDAFGIKPLYYFVDREHIAFASRLQPLMLLSDGRIKEEALAEYYFTRACRGANTIFTDIHELRPGEAVIFDLRTFSLRQKVSWAKPSNHNRWRRDRNEALGALDAAMQQSIDRHLVADVPVATLLSGGVDSGLITALAAQRNPELSAFSIGFRNPAFDESRYAAAVCGRYGVRHHLRYCDDKEFSALLMEWPEIIDDAVADPSAVMLYILAQFAHDMGYKVVLTGDGADEIFGGYNQYYRFQLARRLYPYLRHFPWLQTIIDRLASTRSRYVHFARTAISDPHYYGTGMIFEPHLIRSLVKTDEILLQKSPDLSGALSLDLAHRLPDDMLTRTDRATMHASVEARVPFLTRYVGHVAWSLHEDLLIHGRTRKYLLKKLAERYIPRACIYRPKRGFDMPLADWFRGAMKNFIGDTLASSWQKEFLTFNAMQRVVDDHLAFRNNNADKIWAFILLEGNVRHLRSVAQNEIKLRYNFATGSLERVAVSTVISTPSSTGTVTALELKGAIIHRQESSAVPSAHPKTTNDAQRHDAMTEQHRRRTLSILILSPDPSVPGGVSVFAETLKSRLKNCRVTSLWVGSQNDIKENWLGIMKRLIITPWQTAQLARSGVIDIIHINPSIDRSMKSVVRDGIILLALRAINFRRILVYIHGWDNGTAQRIRGLPPLRRLFVWLLNGVSAIMVLAPEFKAILVELGVAADKITVTRTMFDGQLLQDPPSSHHKEGRRSILFMSRFERSKGVYELLEGFAAVANEFPDVDLVMAGIGDEFDGLRTRVIQTGLDQRVIFTGYVTGAAKAACLHQCTIFALPTYFPEGMPIALLEGMAAGKPILTAKAGAISHIVADPDNGVVLGQVTAEHIAAALRRLLSDPGYCTDTGQRNAAYAWEKFEAGAVSEDIATIYQRIAATS